MYSYMIWWGQLPRAKDGTGCKNHHTEVLLNQVSEATDLLTNTPQFNKRDAK